MTATTPPRGPSGRAGVPSTSPTRPSRTGPGNVYGRRSRSTPVAVPPAGGGPGGPGGRGPGGGGPGGLSGRPGRGRPKPRWGRIALVLGVGVLVLALLAMGGTYLYATSLNKDLKRTDPFSAITGGRPAETVNGTMNILLVGSDSRDPDAPVDTAGRWRADTLMVMHIPSSQDKAYLVSIPRDLYVTVPASPDGQWGGGRAKINAAFAWGGLPLAVQTVEGFTGLRMDHVMLIDFAGFKEVTDALGGVDLKVEEEITSIHKPFRTFKKGMNHMDGAAALDYVRQRKQFAEGDFARMRHQQQFLRALMDKAASTGTLTNPIKLKRFLDATTAAVTVDQSFSLVDMAIQFRGLRGENLVFLTSPHNGSDMINGESVVISDREKAISMYEAMANDTMAQWYTADKAEREEQRDGG